MKNFIFNLRQNLIDFTETQLKLNTVLHWCHFYIFRIFQTIDIICKILLKKYFDLIHFCYYFINVYFSRDSSEVFVLMYHIHRHRIIYIRFFYVVLVKQYIIICFDLNIEIKSNTRRRKSQSSINVFFLNYIILFKEI